MTVLVENWNYLVVICLMMGGLFIVISQNNLVMCPNLNLLQQMKACR